MLHQRKIYKTLIKNIDNNKIIILTGARQVGKTTLMKIIYKNVKKKHNAVFIDMDLATNQDTGAMLENLIDYLILNGYNRKLKRFFLFIDEFQRAPKMAMILKNIYDHYPNIKIFVSGSSSLSIKQRTKESLAGRKFIFEIYPLDFEEFLEFKQNKKVKIYFKNIKNLKAENVIIPLEFKKLLEEFIIFGGYPEVALNDKREDKKRILKSIFDLYIEKDIMLFSGIENLWAYKKIVQILAVGSGNLLNYNNLAQEAELHNKTVRSYLSILENTYLIKILRPFYSNKHSEITKSPKIYFLDNGVKNYFLNNFNPLKKRTDSGSVFESYILQEIIKNNRQEYGIKFWRTKKNKRLILLLKKSRF